MEQAPGTSVAPVRPLESEQRALARSEEKLGLTAITAIGIGGMIGGGIFAVLGLAIATAGHAVALTLLGGGLIALVTGLSYASLGLVFRGNGGSFTYIRQAFPGPVIAGVAGWLLVAGYVGTLALYATAFGDYGAALLGGSHPQHSTAVLLACAGLILFLGVNLVGARLSGGVEVGVVATKLAILLFFAAVALVRVRVGRFLPVFNHGIASPLAAVALIFVAYEGFELIPNAVDEMKNPARNLRRAIVIAILVTTAVYIVVAVAAVGNLTSAQIQNQQEYVLAVAAEPTLGHAGFVLISVAAVLSTASAINATLFGSGRLAMVMSRQQALPGIFSRHQRSSSVPYISLIVLTGLAVAFTLVARLDLISVFASATFLLIFMGVNLSAWRLARRIDVHPWLPLSGAILTGASFIILLWHIWSSDRSRLLWLVGFYLLALVAKLLLTRWQQRGEL